MTATTTLDELVAGFEQRRAGRVDAGDLVAGNMDELSSAGITAAAVPDGAQRRQVLRAVAGRCGATAFALAAGFSTDLTDQTIHDAAVRLGLAERAFALATDRIPRLPGGAEMLPGAQFAAGRMRAALETMNALLDRQAGRATQGGPQGQAEACVAGMYVTAEAEAVVSAAFGVLGGDADATERLSQIWHDLKATPPPVSLALAQELVGKAAFGIDPAESPRWL